MKLTISLFIFVSVLIVPTKSNFCNGVNSTTDPVDYFTCFKKTVVPREETQAVFILQTNLPKEPRLVQQLLGDSADANAPQRLTEFSTDTVFYDFPYFSKPFSDTLSNYFLKEVAKKVSIGKFVVSFSYGQIKNEAGREQVLQFFEYFGFLAKKYRENTVLVVTEVDVEDVLGKLKHLVKNLTIIDDLKTIEIVRKGSKEVKNVKASIETTPYAKTTVGDFAFNLSKQASLEMDIWMKNFSKHFTTIVTNACDDVNKHYEQRSTSFQETAKYFKNEHSLLSEATATKNNFSTFFHKLSKFLGRHKIRLWDKDPGFVDFVLAWKERDLEWVGPLMKLEERISELELWYNFVLQVLDRLPTFTFIKSLRKLHDSSPETNLAKHAVKILAQEQLIDVNTSMRLEKMNQNMPDELGNIIKRALESGSKFSCNNGRTVIFGDFIFMSDIVGCQIVDIFCFNTFFLDVDYSSPESMGRVSIISPKWVIMGTRKIEVDGEKGKDLGRAKRGMGGKAGLPGGSGGVFFGIGYDFRGIEKLEIDVSGGEGGRGQEGGQGSDAKESNLHFNFSSKNPFENMDYSVDKLEKYEIYKVKHWGEQGGDGHRPGSGGRGGRPGIVNIYHLHFKPNIKITSMKGQKGPKGPCGPGGQGSKLVTYHIRHQGSSWTIIKKKVSSSLRNKPGRCNSDVNYSTSSLKPRKPTFPNEIMLGILNEYRLYMLHSLKDTFDKKIVQDFYLELSEFRYVHGEYKSREFVNELKNLESVPDQHVDFIPFYTSLQDKLEKFSFEVLSVQDKKILATTYTATLRWIKQLQSASRCLIVNIDEHYSNIQHNIRSLLTPSRSDVPKNVYETLYQKNFYNRTLHISSLIQNIILPKIPEIQSKNLDKIHDILQKPIEEVRSEWQGFVETLKVKAGSELFYMIGTITSSILDLGKSIAFVKDSTSPIIQPENPPKLNTSILQPLPRIIDTTVDEIYNFLQKKNDTIAIVLQDLEHQLENDLEVSVKVEAIQKKLETTEDIIAVLQELDELRGEIQIEAAEHSFVVAGIDEEIYLDFRTDKAALQILAEAINGDEISKAVRNFISYVVDLTRWLEKIKNDVRLETSLWEVEFHVKTLKTYAQFATAGVCPRNDLVLLSDMLQDAMNSILELYERIQSHLEEKSIANYLNVLGNPVGETTKKLLADMGPDVKYNLILHQTRLAIDAFKQVVFPFAPYFHDEIQVRPGSTNLAILTNSVETVERLGVHLAKLHYGVVKEIDTHVHEKNFTFFTWKKEKYEEIISELLDGEEVVLKADVRNPNVLNVVKFSRIFLEFRAEDPGLLEPLDRFDVSLRHFGNSYYRCDEKVFVLSSNSRVFEFSYKKDRFGSPVNRNQMYVEVENGGFLLSPYALWSVKLLDMENFSFESLEGLKGKVDLVLVGRGQYIMDKKICESNLRDYYKIEDVMEQDGQNYECEYNL